MLLFFKEFIAVVWCWTSFIVKQCVESSFFKNQVRCLKLTVFNHTKPNLIQLKVLLNMISSSRHFTSVILSGFVLIRSRQNTPWHRRWFRRRNIVDSLGWESPDSVIPIVYDGLFPSLTSSTAGSIVIVSYFISAFLIIISGWESFFPLRFDKITWQKRQTFWYGLTKFSMLLTFFTIYIVLPAGESLLLWRASRITTYGNRLHFNWINAYVSAGYGLSNVIVELNIWWGINACRWRLFVENPTLTLRSLKMINYGYALNGFAFWSNAFCLLTWSIYLMQGWYAWTSLEAEKFSDSFFGSIFYKLTGAPVTREEQADRRANRMLKRRLFAEKLLKKPSTHEKKTPKYKRFLAKMRLQQLRNKQETGTALYNNERLRILLAKTAYIKEKRKPQSLQKNKIKVSRDIQMSEAWERYDLFRRESWTLMPNTRRLRSTVLNRYWPNMILRLNWHLVDSFYLYRDRCLEYLWPAKDRNKLRFHFYMIPIRLNRRFYNWLYTSKNPVVTTTYHYYKHIKKFIKKVRYLTIKTLYYYCIKPLWYYVFKPVNDFFIRPLLIFIEVVYIHMLKPAFVQITTPFYDFILKKAKVIYRSYGGKYFVNYVKYRLPHRHDWEKQWRQRWLKYAEATIKKRDAERDYGAFVNKFGVLKYVINTRLTKYVWNTIREDRERKLKKQELLAKQRKARSRIVRRLRRQLRRQERKKRVFGGSGKTLHDIDMDWARYEESLVRQRKREYYRKKRDAENRRKAEAAARKKNNLKKKRKKRKQK